MASTLTRHDANEIRSILRDKFEYYNKLSLKGKKKFYARLIHFIRSKRFIGKEGLKITPEILVLVGASAVQLTFGLKRYLISHFKVIMMFPSTFHFRLLNKDLKGGASPRGTLWLSWESFQHGYEIPDDKRNLGLHEMAHALKLNVLNGYTFDAAFASYIEDWNEVATKEFRHLKGGGASFFRKYGGTNRMEFFAVAVEHFFEAPEEFHEELPDIYNHLCVLLNQNPLNERQDFELTSGYIKMANLKRRKFPLPEKIILSYKYTTWHWSYILVFVGFMIAGPQAFILYEETLVSEPEMYVLIGLVIIIGGILQYPFLVKNEAWPLKFYPVYLVMAWAPIACFALLQLNFSYTTLDHNRVERHNVESIGWSSGNRICHLEDGVYWNRPAFRTKKTNYSNIEISDDVQYEMTFRRGLLGYWVLIDKKLVLAL